MLTDLFSVEYFRVSRHPVYGLFAILPLLILYEWLVIRLADVQVFEIRNFADVLLRQSLSSVGVKSHFILLVFLAALIIGLIVRDRDSTPLRFHYFLFIILESAMYSCLVGLVVGFATTKLLAQPAPIVDSVLLEKIMLSVGAGVYEEIVFRAIIFAVTAFIFIKIFKVPVLAAFIIAALFSSLIFALLHVNDREKLIFRFLAGIFFCILFQLRGLGVCAWTHALYDLFIVINT